MSYCGYGTLTRPHPDKPHTTQFIKAGCKKLSCPECAPYKTKVYKAAVVAAAQKHKLIRLLTLTLDPGLIPPQVDSFRYIARVWNNFKRWLEHHKGLKLTYVRTYEMHASGVAHIHVVMRECISQDEIIQAWRECGGGHQCRISIPRYSDPARYASKYISKALAEQLPKGTRVLSCSRGILLFPPPPDNGWCHVKAHFITILAGVRHISWRAAWESPVDAYFEHTFIPEEHIPWTLADCLIPKPQGELSISTT